MLRRIFGPKRDKVPQGWRKLHNKEPDNLYSSPDIIRMIKSWTITWTEHVAFIGEERREICTKFR
jgi:hypothetical protein